MPKKQSKKHIMTTKKTFIKTAKMIAEMANRDEAKKLAENFAKIYNSENPRFDFGKFYSACKVTQP
jgi:hypothetical protein